MQISYSIHHVKRFFGANPENLQPRRYGGGGYRFMVLERPCGFHFHVYFGLLATPGVCPSRASGFAYADTSWLAGWGSVTK